MKTMSTTIRGKPVTVTIDQASALGGLRRVRAELAEIEQRPFSQRNGVDHVHAVRALKGAADKLLRAFGCDDDADHLDEPAAPATRTP